MSSEASQGAAPLDEHYVSVGAPSPHVYETVKDVRAARSKRLGAVQRKLPGLQFAMLYALAAGLLSSFVVTTAGYARGQSLAMERAGFAVLSFALVTCLRVLEDIWSPTSGAYSVSGVLDTMLVGLEAQLDDLLEAPSPVDDLRR